VAHRSGKLDGIVVVSQGKDATHYTATVSVHRKDMSHPFTYVGRYPFSGSNKAYGPEMAVKCAEVMALRRAFDVSLCAREEIWDQGEDIDVTPTTTTTKAIAAPARKTVSLEAQWNTWLANAAHNLGLTSRQLEAALQDWMSINDQFRDGDTVADVAISDPYLWQDPDGGFRLACRRLKLAQETPVTVPADDEADPDLD